MRLKHESNPEIRTDKQNHTFGERMKSKAVKAIHSLGRFGRALLVGGLIAAPSAGAFVGCTDGQTQEEEPVFPKTGIKIIPYNGEILQDENGTYYMATRFIVAFKEGIQVSDSEVEELTGGKITGKIPGLNAYQVEVAKEKLDETIGTVGKDRPSFRKPRSLFEL
ncbi:MAG: hypothetical protein ABII22_02500 [Candidatus Micrarchaeota archaeon]